MDCDIVLLPEKALADRAIATSQELAVYGNLAALHEGKSYPHLSLYMATVKGDDVEKVRDIVREIAATTSPIYLSAHNYGGAGNYLVVNHEITEATVRLQRQILDAVVPLHQGIMRKDIANAEGASGVALRNYQTYGYKYIDELFAPHITLGVFADKPELDTLPLPNPTVFTGVFTQLGLFELGEYNTCVRQIAEFELRA